MDCSKCYGLAIAGVAPKCNEHSDPDIEKTTKIKNESMGFRTTVTNKTIILKACKKAKTNLANFLLESALKEAKRILEKQE